MPCLLPGSSLQVPATGAWLGRGRGRERGEEGALLALLNISNGCYYLLVGRLLSSAGKGWLPFCQVHQLVLMVLEALEVV